MMASAKPFGKTRNEGGARGITRRILVLLAILVLGPFTPPAGASFPGREKVLDPSLLDEFSKSTRPLAVIVTLREPPAMKDIRIGERSGALRELQRIIDDAQDRVAEKLDGGHIEGRLENAPVVVARVAMKGIHSLAAMNEVAYIEEDMEMVPMTRQGLPLIGLSRSGEAGGGAGVSVAVVDTGVNYGHPALGGGRFPNGKVIGGYDFGDRDRDPMDRLGHGTSCAGIVAGQSTGRGDFIGGVAPEAGIYALKVADSQGRLSSSAMFRAWDWCISHQNDDPRRPIRVISTSLGTPGKFSRSYCTFRAAEKVVEQAERAGIAIFVSSGNEARNNGISFTACLEGTISVGAVYDASFGGAQFSRCADNRPQRDQVTCYSNSAPILDLLAPSHMACTAGVPGANYAERFGGTSAACPYAAGAAALIQSRAKAAKGHFLSVRELRSLMKRTGDGVTDPKSGIRTPRVNLRKALAALGEPEERTDDGDGLLDEVRDILESSRKQ